MNRALLPLQRYAEFNGRSRRSEYWLFTLLISIVTFIFFLAFILYAAGTSMGQSGIDKGSAGTPSGLIGAVILLGLLYLAILVPSIAVQVRRFHDQDRSGWLVLVNFVPYVGSLIVLIFMCIDGTDGPNRYGPDPKAGLPVTF